MNPTSVAAQPLSDWNFCQQSLEEVSRTFTQPIRLLPEKQMRALTVGYLLCRVVDTIEDCTGIDEDQRDALYSSFQSVLRGRLAPEKLSEQFKGALASETELRLFNNLPRVLNVFFAQEPKICRATVRWVSEMCDGMRLYSRRAEGREFFALMTLTDLERYCYFVAGTVGHLITELFDDVESLEPRLRDHAESFGLGLQMVNIVKDVTEDFSRGVCYLPRQLCRAEGIEPEELLDPVHRQTALHIAGKVIARAKEHLSSALEYVLLIPKHQQQLRLFCLLPLWMALETLALAKNNEDIFVVGRKVKISRETVARLIADCGRDCRDDDALRAAFATMTSDREG